jgi:PqqD family protein of HPr-rel-A system
MHKVSDSLRSTHGPDGAVVLDIRQGKMFNLNPVASRILQRLEHGATEAEIVTAICSEFSANRQAVESDLREFIDVLKKNQLITEP